MLAAASYSVVGMLLALGIVAKPHRSSAIEAVGQRRILAFD